MHRNELVPANGYRVHGEREGSNPCVLVHRFTASGNDSHSLAWETANEHSMHPWAVWNVGPDGHLYTGAYYKQYGSGLIDLNNR